MYVIRVSHVTDMNERGLSHVGMSHVILINESRHTHE